MPPAAHLRASSRRASTGRNPITAATPASTETPVPAQEAPNEIAPIQFVEPEPAHAQEHQPHADHSEAGMRELRTPFNT